MDQVVLPGQEDNQFLEHVIFQGSLQFQGYVTFQGFRQRQEDNLFLEHAISQGLWTCREQSKIMTLRCQV